MTITHENINCFISVPFSRKYDQLTSEILIPELERKQIKPILITRQKVQSDIYDWIVSSIRKSDIFLCEVTDKNPNIIYELGLAHAWGIPTLILSQKLYSIPFELSKYRILLYDDSPNGIDILKEEKGE